MVVQLVVRLVAQRSVVRPRRADVFIEFTEVHRRAGCRRFDVAGTTRCSSLRSSAQGDPELFRMAA
eukprot:1173529-Pyramimonas_sp.AAC.1